MTARLASAAALAAALAGLALPARAAEVQVGPVSVDLSPSARSAVVTVRNQGKEAARFELQVRRWDQGSDGEMQLSATEEIAVYPPVLAVAPGDERIFRIGAVTPFGPVERTFRVIVQELPPPETPESGAQVRMLTRMLLPVFLAPGKAVQKASLAGLAAQGGKVRVRLVNEGTVHVRPESVKLTGLGKGGAVLFESELPAWYVLAGGERAYVAEIPPVACAGLREVQVTAAIGRELLHAKASASRACAP